MSYGDGSEGQFFPAPSAAPRPFAPTAVAADDFLGLEHEIARPAHPSAWPAAPFPSREPAPVPLAPAAAMPPSWLLQLDDARAGRAGLEPVVPSAGAAHVDLPPPPVDASFCDESAQRAELIPWIVRGLVGAALVCFVLVVVQAFRVRSRDVPPPQFSAPLAPTRVPSAEKERLADPGLAPPTAIVATGARPSPRSSSSTPVQPSSEPSAPTALAMLASAPAMLPAPVVAVDTTNVDAAELPAWWPGAFPRTSDGSTSTVTSAGEARSGEARERLDRWLLVHARSTAPAADALVASAGPLPVDRFPSGTPAPAAPEGEVWTGTTIPIERVIEARAVATPNVGRVRLALKSGESVEGTLAALGRGKLWLDARVGRVELAASEVARIEPLQAASATIDAAALPRMRVRTPGKTYYGKVLERGDDGVLVLTDAGERVRVRTDDIEPAPARARAAHKAGSVLPGATDP